MSDTVIIVPCYNERARLRLEPFVHLCATHPHLRFLFVDDGSTDGTSTLIRSEGVDLCSRVGLLTLEQNVGKAEAVRRGFAAAFERAPRYVGFWDADLATPLDVIPAFEATLDDHPALDMVFGARVKLLGRSIERRMWRHYVGRVFATAVSIILRLPVYDTQCGAKLFRCDARLQEAFARPFLARWVFDVEIVARYMLIQMREHGRSMQHTIYELPLDEWADVAGSKLKATDFVKAARDLVRIAWAYRRSASPQPAREPSPAG